MLEQKTKDYVKSTINKALEEGQREVKLTSISGDNYSLEERQEALDKVVEELVKPEYKVKKMKWWQQEGYWDGDYKVFL